MKTITNYVLESCLLLINLSLKMKLLILVASVLLQILVTSGSNDYYWRDFSSEISKDAVPGGKDAAGKQTYIGQTYIHNLGVFVMQITPGVTNPDFAAYGVKKPGPVIKILCSKDQEKFSWITTTSKTFHLDTTGKHAVIGGHDHVDANKGMLHVGRLAYQGGIKIGSISGYALENAQFHFVGGAAEKKATSYEVLMFSRKVNNEQNSTPCVSYTDLYFAN
jgi:hypothetical protein